MVAAGAHEAALREEHGRIQLGLRAQLSPAASLGGQVIEIRRMASVNGRDRNLVMARRAIGRRLIEAELGGRGRIEPRRPVRPERGETDEPHDDGCESAWGQLIEASCPRLPTPPYGILARHQQLSPCWRADARSSPAWCELVRLRTPHRTRAVEIEARGGPPTFDTWSDPADGRVEAQRSPAAGRSLARNTDSSRLISASRRAA